MTLQTRLGQRLRSTLFLALAALLLASCSASLNANRIEAGSAAGSESRTQPGLRADWDQLAELPWPQSGQHDAIYGGDPRFPAAEDTSGLFKPHLTCSGFRNMVVNAEFVLTNLRPMRAQDRR